MTSLEWWRQRPAAFTATLGDFPTLDEAWLWYLVGRAKGGPLHRSLEAMCVYAEDVRQGRWPDRVEPELAVQSIFLSMAQRTLATSRAAFEEEARVLFDAIAKHLETGGSLVDTPFLASVPAAQRDIAAMKEDQRLFTEDLRRAQRHEVVLPAEASLTRTERAVSMLVLDRPASTQFKLWARKDARCALLLTRLPDGVVVLSVDPSWKLKLGWLAPLLSAREGAPWYDGSRHDGTLIASPKEGSKLGLDGVLDVMSRRARVLKRRPIAALGVAVAASALIFVYLFAAPQTPASPEETQPAASGAKGDPIPPAKVLDLLAAADGPKSYEPFALIAGVCGYVGERELRAPCRDARAMRELLLKRLGYRRENILFFVDRPEPGEVTDGIPTAANLKLAVERFRAQHPADETSSFLFYYSGHGGYEKGARKDFGVLQPSGYFENEAAPMSDRGWDMQELLDDLRKGVPSRHVMVLLDACYSGWAVGAKGDERLSGDLKTLWAERAEVVITAGTRGQRAWEDEAEQAAWQWSGHSAFTAFLLQGLGESGRPQADLNGDRVVTDEELARYLRERVPAAVRSLKRADQLPQFFRFDEQLPKSGQFLFLPAETP